MMNDPPRTEEQWRPTPKMIVGGIIGLLALIFVFQNTGKKQVNFLWMDFNAPAWMWLLIIFLAGALVGYMFARRQAKRAAARGA
jgi:lipopolysaccharide assembly protein A